MSQKPNIQISARNPFNKKRESPSLAKGVRLRLLSLRGSWVQIPSPALATNYKLGTYKSPFLENEISVHPHTPAQVLRGDLGKGSNHSARKC